MKTIHILYFLALTLSMQVRAGQKDELLRLYKCHALFVSERITPAHPLWKAVSEGSKTGAEACLEILDLAALDSDGKIKKDQLGVYDKNGIKILKNFLFFYKSQFHVPSFASGISQTSSSSINFIDSNEPSYHFMFSLFKTNEPFSNILTRQYGIRASRYTKKTQRHRSIATTAPYSNLFYTQEGEAFFKQGHLVSARDENASLYFFAPVNSPNPAIDFFPLPIETGLLVGLSPETNHNYITELPLQNLPVGHPWNDALGHYGGGILGTQAYMLGNMTNLSLDFAPNGGTKMQRRFGENILSDFLCRDNPALRAIDVISEVRADSTIPFRKGISCMRCHTGMDPLSGVARNLVYAVSHNAPRFGQLGFLTKRSVSDPQKVLWASTGKIANYDKSEPLGRLMYRSYDGTLVREDVSGIHELGKAIAQKNDFYACAAKKHFQFLTGIEVNLQDPGDIDSKKLTDAEKMYRNQVIKLGLELKEHQSLKLLMKKIIESPTFIAPDKGV